MITTALLNFIHDIIFSVIRNFPDATLPADITNAVSNANGYLASLNFIFPVSTLATIFGLLLIIEVAIVIYKVIMWFIKKIPTIS